MTLARPAPRQDALMLLAVDDEVSGTKGRGADPEPPGRWRDVVGHPGRHGNVEVPTLRGCGSGSPAGDGPSSPGAAPLHFLRVSPTRIPGPASARGQTAVHPIEKAFPGAAMEAALTAPGEEQGLAMAGPPAFGAPHASPPLPDPGHCAVRGSSTPRWDGRAAASAELAVAEGWNALGRTPLPPTSLRSRRGLSEIAPGPSGRA